MKSLKHRVFGDGIEVIGCHVIALDKAEANLGDESLASYLENWFLAGYFQVKGVDPDMVGVRRYRERSRCCLTYTALAQDPRDSDAAILFNLMCEQNPT